MSCILLGFKTKRRGYFCCQKWHSVILIGAILLCFAIIQKFIQSITQHILVINIKNSVTLAQCTSTVFCIWPDDGSVNQNILPNF